MTPGVKRWEHRDRVSDRRLGGITVAWVLTLGLLVVSCTSPSITPRDDPVVTAGPDLGGGIVATYASSRVAVDWSQFARETAAVVEARVWSERDGVLLGDCTAYWDWCDIRPIPVRPGVTLEVLIEGTNPGEVESLWFDLEQTSAPPNPSGYPDLAEVERLREDLRTRIFGFREGLAGVTVEDIVEPCPELLSAYCTTFSQDGSISALRVTMDHGITAIVGIIEPPNPSVQAVVWHRGHEPELETVPSFVQFIRELLDRGTTVYLVSMLLFPPNPSYLVVTMPDRGAAIIAQHDDLFLLQSGEKSALRFMVQPGLAALEHARQHHEDVEVMGISGGGWSAVMVAALDADVRATTSIAGTVPVLELLGTAPYLPDFEQRLPGLFPDLDYLDLYVLGAVPDRRLRLLYNSADPCCFAQPDTPDWVAPTRRVIEDLGGTLEVEVIDSFRHDVDARSVLQ